MGAWLRANGAAIHGARPWRRSDAVAADGTAVRFTAKAGDLYVIPLGSPGTAFDLPGVRLEGRARRLADGAPVELQPTGDGVRLGFAAPQEGTFAPVVVVEGAG